MMSSFKDICEDKLKEASTSNINIEGLKKLISHPSMSTRIDEIDFKTQKSIAKQVSALIKTLDGIL